MSGQSALEWGVSKFLDTKFYATSAILSPEYVETAKIEGNTYIIAIAAIRL
jgi:hypothetical protein